VPSQSDRAVLALDVGTSSCRASLYDLQARPMPGRSAHIVYAPSVTSDGGAELEPEVLLEQVEKTVGQVLAGTPPRLVAVAVSTFWHSLIGVDSGGRPITPVYLWLDARSRAQMEILRSRLDERAVHARTGCVLHWSYWPAKLSWLRATQPAVFQQVSRWMSFGELLLERFTGATGVSVSMASGTGLLNVHTCDWDDTVMSAVGLDRAHLNPILPLEPIGTSDRWPSLENVPWLPAIGDGACSNLGAGCSTPDRFALMVGTSGAERAAWTPQAEFTIPWGAWCYRIDERRAVIGGALNDGGSLLDWLRGALRLPEFEAAEAEVAAMEPDSHGLTVLPFWAGERNPGWADDARGAITGMRLHTRPVDILRASLEAVALRFAEIDNILHKTLPDAAEVVATGGALLHSKAWMQIIANALGRPVLASAEAEASSRGACLLALEALDLLGVPVEELQPEVTERFEPVAAHTLRYQAALERQRHLYDALLR
jgi:gluconokinase